MKKFNNNFVKPFQEQLNTLLEYYQVGRYVDAEKISVSITKEFPEDQFAWKVLAAVLIKTGKISESLVAGQKSVKLEPQDSEAHNNLGVILQKMGRLDEAEASYRKAIELKQEYVEFNIFLFKFYSFSITCFSLIQSSHFLKYDTQIIMSFTILWF